MSRSRASSFLWKISSGFVIAMVAFGAPLADILPTMPFVPVAYAQNYPGVANQAGVMPCSSIFSPGVSGAPGLAGICTDVGQYEAAIGKIKKKIDYQLTFAAYLGLLNAATYFAQTIAYDTAEWAANGFKGQAPGIYTDPFGTYTKNLALNAVGEFMGTFSEKFTQGVIGVDLCRPPNFPQLALDIAIGLPGFELNAVQRPRPKCAWTTVVSNWEQSYQSLSNAESLTNIRANFSSGGNDVSFAVGSHLAFFNAVGEARYNGIQERILGQGYKDVTNFISGNIETPAQTVQRSIENQVIENPAMAQNTNTGALMSNAFELGWVQLGVVTASTFTNVLLSRLLQKVAKGLIKSDGSGSGGLNLLNPLAATLGGTSPQEIFASQFSDLLTPRVNRADAQDLLTELAACPTDGRTKWNCAMDESLAAALRQGGGLTVRQAIDQGFINDNWELIPSTRLRDNQDPTCRSRAFCVANLRKLRLSRVLPVGWELAADSPVNQQSCAASQGCVTLGEVISKFDDCSDAGSLDEEHPYCHLIDPNWVLTVFPAQCQTQGYGNQLIAGTSQRLQECQDTATCLERDKDGNCTGGYGFCMAEQTFWQFDAPTCREQFASCRTFQPRGQNAKPVSYLRSTLDYGSCNESNVGCMWYATRRNPAGTDTDSAWAATTTPPFTTRSHPAADSGRVYFDKTVQTCDPGNDGCTALRRTVRGQAALNLLPNGSFEQATGTPVVPDGWGDVFGTLVGDDWFTPPSVADGTASFDGTRALYPAPSRIGTTELVSKPMIVEPLRQYVLSFYARKVVNGSTGARVRVVLTGALQNALAATGGTTYFRSSDCSISTPDQAGVVIPNTLGSDWSRFSCSFVTPPDVGRAEVRINAGTSDATSPLIDAIQLEEAEVAAPFVDGVNTSLTQLHMKVPPQELSCSGNPQTDNALCSNFARVCRQQEAGCQGYRPVGDASSPEIPAVLTAADSCPAECAGYAEFRKQPSTFDLTRDPDPRLDDPQDDTVATFVPNTTLSCSVQDVGCEAFTNLDAATQGGEAQEAYRYLRACEKPDGASQTYYTWEGSDTSGYQLKTWSLKRDTNAPFPQGPKIIQKTGSDGRLKEPGACTAANYVLATDPDCRQFYDPQGNVFYRFESQTVLSTNECRQYRKEASTVADCEKTGGAFNTATSQCTYQAEASTSLQCDVAVAGCRGYAGTQGRAQEETFVEEFATDGYKAVNRLTGNTGASLTLSDESILVGDKSLRIQRAGSANTVNLGPMLFEDGALYELTFWAKTPTPNGPALTMSTVAADGTGSTVVEATTLSTNWKTYRVGPFSSPAAGDRYIALTATGVDTWFIDRVRVTRVQDVVYAVKNSWNTPVSCDSTPEGIPQPQAMLGCRAYTDRKGTQVNVRQFTRLCREEVIGCSAYVNSRNSTNLYTESWDAPVKPARTTAGPERTNAYGDRYDYYVEDASKFCPAAADGCRAFGKPNYTQSRLSLDPKPFTTVYLLDRPDQYDEALCSETELFCEAYSYAADSGDSGTAYFRAPGVHACEYRSAVVVADGSVPNVITAGRTYDGWFQIGTDLPCHPDRLQDGGSFGIRLTGDVGYNGWAGANSATDPLYPAGQNYRGWTATCPEAQAECTELRDVNDTSDPQRPSGRPYFVINDSQLDKTSCAGQVDPGRGCVLFRDTSDTRLLSNSAATYHLYKTRAYQSVPPVDCVGQPEHPSCVEMSQTTNDTNVVIKVKPDRSCSEWLSCSTSETVFDPQDGQYKSLCSALALCNKAGAVEGAGIPFCANYLNRTSGNQTLLKQYGVINAQAYAARKTGFGAKDYSGSTVPNQFQVMDADLIPVGARLSPDPRVQSRYKKDYRLAVAVPILVTGTFPTQTGTLAFTSFGAMPPSAQQLQALANTPELAPYACVFKAPGGGQTSIRSDDMNVSFGIRTDADENLSTTGNLCWLAVDQTQPPQLGVSGAPLVSDNLNVLNLVQRLSQSEQPNLDQTLSRSFPNTQCKAAPEADAPFGNEYVVEWDDTVTPARPKRALAGYGQTNLCEYGEDCACTYKRVEYGGPSRFYEPLSTDVANAMCVGGPRDGQPCALDAAIKGSQQIGKTEATDANGNPITVDLSSITQGENSGRQNPNTTCGEGVCSPIKNVKLVRGGVGQCLQYDLSRSIAGDPSRNECLVWSPNPVFAGPSDPYHWIPTAGFQPPQSSGRYYCTAPYRAPKNIPFRPYVKVPAEGAEVSLGAEVGFIANSAKTYAGAITKFWYQDAVASDKSCFSDGALLGAVLGGPVGAAIGESLDDCDGNEPGGSLDGSRSEGTDMGLWCEQADDDQSPSSDFNAVRLVTTGRGGSRSYAEYAVLFNTEQVGKVIAGYAANSTSVDPDIIFENSLEDAIAGFEFSTDYNKLGCSYSEDWVQGVGGADYDDRASWEPKDKQWQAGFRAELAKSGNRLDRKKAQIVTEDGSGTGTPVKVECHNPDNEPEDGSGCYLKVWNLDYRAEGQLKHQAFGPDIGRASMDSLSKSPVYGKCDSDHSWFSIRAVFENTNTGENAKDPSDVNPDALAGPFQAVGFWVTACSPASGPRYIYMRVNMNTADVCRELAETISKDSHDSVAFTDRNSERSGFTIPRSGFQWATTNIPFGASLATRDAGTEPLYMTGVRQAASNPLHPPAFTYPGQTYFRPERYPTSNWGLLSNIFAKIYRIYAYDPRGVSRDDWACTSPVSPNFGQWCPDLSTVEDDDEKEALSRKYCGFEATCVKSALSGDDIFAQRVCNSFSGVNRGLDCSADPDVCHRGPAQLGSDGVLRTQYTSCDAQGGWTQLSTGRWRCTGSSCPGNNFGPTQEDCADNCNTDTGCGKSVAIRCGAFQCGPGSARSTAQGVNGNASFCSTPQSESPECPLYIPSEPCVIDDPGNNPFGYCQSHPWAQCKQDEDCHFIAQNYWPSGPANAFVNWTPNPDVQYGARYGNKDAANPTYGYVLTSNLTMANLDAPCAGGKWDDAACIFKNAFTPALPAQAPDATRFFAQNVNAADDVIGEADGDDGQRIITLYPGFVPTVGSYSSVTASFNPSNTSAVRGDTKPLFASSTEGPPYVSFVPMDSADAYCKRSTTQNFSGGRGGSGWTSFCSGGPNAGDACFTNADCRATVPSLGSVKVHWGACEPLALMFQDGPGVGSRSLGTCRGGVRSGTVCSENNDCLPDTVRDDNGRVNQTLVNKLRDDASSWCNPVTSGAPDYNRLTKPCTKPEGCGGPPGTEGNGACWQGAAAYTAVDGSGNINRAHPRYETDPAYDSNICTHPPGYWPRPSLCKDPNDEYCGLMGYNLGDLDDSVNDRVPLPTDVTPGLYTPRFLNPSGSEVSSNAGNYNYIRYYNPEPPHAAAPDMRTCQGGVCRVTAMNTIGIDGVSEGIVNGGAGSHVAALRFYAWASHEQMPLRRVIVDWGDGNQTDLPDAFLKNHKPYCQTNKECSLAPGLTCGGDGDCPPGAGTCQAYGSCAADPNRRCSKDAECDSSQGQDGVCNPRVYFGNDEDACEEQFFEFRHAFACSPALRTSLPACSAGKSCQSNPNRACTDDNGCAEGDRCVVSAALKNGCFDSAANACRFTPRLMLVDNWGWCSGECRNTVNPSGTLIDDPNARVKHPNGGCYNPTGIKSNNDANTVISNVNECDVQNPSNSGANFSLRPWIVFPGSVQIRSGETQ